MTKRTSLTTMLALTATLITAPLTPALAQDTRQRGVLSGTTGNLAWTLYGPGQLTGFSEDPQGTLRVSAPQNARSPRASRTATAARQPERRPQLVAGR